MKYICTLFFAFLAFVIIKPATYTVLAQSTRLGANLSQSELNPKLATSTVYDYITEKAKKVGVDPIIAQWIVSKESQLGQNLKGDDGDSLGYWMIDQKYHPEVTKDCSLDLACSTSWSLNWIKSGHLEQWSTFACKYAWFYKDAVTTFGLPPKDYKEPKYCK